MEQDADYDVEGPFASHLAELCTECDKVVMPKRIYTTRNKDGERVWHFLMECNHEL